MQGKSSCTMKEDCLINIMDYGQTYKEKLKNYERQKKRIISQNKTIHNKNAKKDNFKERLEILQEAIGVKATGFLSSLQNETTDLVDSFSSCSEEIGSACVIEVDLPNDSGNSIMKQFSAKY